MRSNCSGLDFTKAVVIKKKEYIGESTLIDNNEYSEFINKRSFIAKKFENFIAKYKKWALDPIKYHAENIISFSALQYFHRDLGL